MDAYRDALTELILLVVAVIAVLIVISLLLSSIRDMLKEIAGDLKERDE